VFTGDVRRAGRDRCQADDVSATPYRGVLLTSL